MRFQAQTLDDERTDKGTIISVRLNSIEYASLQSWAEILDQPESTAIKILMGLGKNVLHNTFPKEYLERLFKNKYKRNL